MSQVRILRIVVASPNDVQEERDALPSVIDELNNGIARERALRLELGRWETDAYPGFHPQGPQGLIDTVLRIEDCDILVGIFWKRFGAPTEDAASGTEHEFRRAYQAWQEHGRPQIMLYFNQKPATPQTKEEIEQWWKVLEFREQLPKEGLWWPYEGVAEFERLVRKHLTQYILRHEGTEHEASLTSGKAAPPPAPDPDEEIRLYCQKAESLHSTLPVAGFATRIKVPIDIEEVYVPLRAMVDLRGLAEESFLDAAHAEESLRGRDAGLEIPLPEAFSQAEKRRKRGIVILGDPGSGKTTHLKRLLLWCIRNGPESIALPPAMLPVFLPLRELRDLDQGLDAFIQGQLDSPHLRTPVGFGERLMRRGNLLFLLDGLDEVADLSQREKVARWIADAVRSHQTCRFVVTCRFAGYSPTVQLTEDFLEMHIRPLTEDQVGGFVENWYRIVERGLAKDPEQAEGVAAEKAESLMERLRDPDFRARRVFELTRNPLLLANICLVHRHRGALPQKRARLYEECIDVLLEHWREAKGLAVGVSAQEGRRVLQPAALWLHSEEGRTRAKAAELVPQIEPVLKTIKWSGGAAEGFLRTIRDESGLLTGWDPEHYGFMHLGFQEYLAAREIRTRAFNDPAVLRELASHFGESWWQEVGLLLLALEDPSLFVPYMREVLKKKALADHPALVEACLDDAAETSVQPFVELLQTAPGRDTGLWQRQFLCLRVIERLDPEVIQSLESKLAQHPAPDIRRWLRERREQAAQEIIISEPGGYELVMIPGGAFLMGSPKSEEGRYDNEEPLHEVRVPDFYMGRYSVTNEEYARFLGENSDVREPLFWAERRFNQPKQPVVGVSWEDARRYAGWAGLRLPSEAEWECACRAGTCTRYCSGDAEEDLDRVGWYGGNSRDRLHPVGEKEPNAFGLYDMHGNVWEWVEDDWHDTYDGAPDDGRAWIDEPRGVGRVFRGGGWYDVAQFCRSAVRRGLRPGDRGSILGFRLARSVSLGS